MANVPHVVIVGGGFGGLFAARRLANEPVRVTVVDRQNYHLFQPLLYQVATAGLSAGDIAGPIRAILAGRPNVEVHLGDATEVSLDAKTVKLADGTSLSWEFLVLATGARHAYFGHPEWEQLAPGLKSLDDALEIRRRVLLAFEAAELETDGARQAALLTFVVVGGGPTGVELAGAVAELARYTVAKDFRAIDPQRARVVLVEAGDRLLNAFDAKLSKNAEQELAKLGVEVRLSTRVTDISVDGVKLGAEALPARTVLWAAGVEASALVKKLGLEHDRMGRVAVKPDLTLPGHDTAYAIGDAAHFAIEGGTLPGLAPVAMQQGRHAGENILATIAGRPRREFHYVDKGIMATVGRAAGIAQTKRLKLGGMLGWLAWLFVHLIFLIGFRNRLLVLIQWAWAYLTYQRSSRLIMGGVWKPGEPTTPDREQALLGHAPLVPKAEASAAPRS